VLDYVSFRTALASHLSTDLDDRGPQTLLRDELGFDSLTMAEISVLFADEGAELPDELLVELRTLGDLHHYAVVLGDRDESASPVLQGATGAAPTGTDR